LKLIKAEGGDGVAFVEKVDEGKLEEVGKWEGGRRSPGGMKFSK